MMQNDSFLVKLQRDWLVPIGETLQAIQTIFLHHAESV